MRLLGMILLAGWGLAQTATTLAAEEPAASPVAASVQLEISGLGDASGSLYVSVYDSDETWLGETTVLRQQVVIEEARDGELVKTRLELQPGEYAISIFYDENGNGKLDANFIGIPKEPVALSNNARPSFGPPKYEDAQFVVGSEALVMRIAMEDI